MRISYISSAFLFTAPFLLAACAAPTPQEEDSQEPQAEETPAVVARYEPPANTILVFAGQSNDAVGGHGEHDDGYVDHFGVPAGFSHYVGFLPKMTTPLGFDFDDDRIEGLNSWDYWGAGPMCLKCYLEDPDFSGTIVHLGLSMEFGSADRISAEGEPDHDLVELATFLETYSAFPFLLRIGYEFDGSWNAYEPESYKAAFIRIVDHLRQAGIDNFATVFASSTQFLPRETWEAYYPGSDYVDWLGYTWWSGDAGQTETAAVPVAHDLAREWGKPILMAEVGPRGYRIGQDDTEKVWDWYETLFGHIDDNADVIKGLAIIDNHWDPEPMWQDGSWGDFRLQNDDTIAERWREKMAEDRFVHATAGTFELIDFHP